MKVLHVKLYKQFSYFISFSFLIIHAVLAVEHCPALSLNFSDFGIEGCPPSFTVNSPEEVDESLKKAKCLGWGKWNLLPSIGCSSPITPKGMALQFPCECDFGGKCKVKCQSGYERNGRDFIECQRNGNWTALPKCIPLKCNKPVLPETMTFDTECEFSEGKACKLKCVSDEYRIEGVSHIICKDSKWSPLPECHRFCSMSKIPQPLVAKHGCVGSHKEICPVECRNKNHTLNGEHTITCLESGEWTEMPVCGCSSDFVPKNIILKKACSLKAGVSCEAVCAPYYYKKGNAEVLVCNKNGAWELSSSIKCLKMCPEPVLSKGLIITNRCKATQGEVCKVKCKEELMRLTESDSFQCLPSGKYSKMPGCAKVDQCSDTVLPSTVKFTGGCRYIYGETCSVGCKDSSFVLEGESTITCMSSGTWSSIPDCVKYCPELKLKPNQMFKLRTPCGKKIGDSCEVKCHKGYFPTRYFSVKCLPHGEWEELTDCQKMCSEPVLPDNVVVLHHCKYVVGSVCTLGCQEKHLVTTPTDKITCLANAKWSEMPECKEECNINDLPSSFKLVNCSQMFEHEECELTCADPNESLFGDHIVECFDTGLSMSEDTVCVSDCKELVLPAGLKTVNSPEDCDYMRPEETCSIKCENELATLSGPDKVTCLGNNEFSAFPTCEFVCQSLQVPRNTQIISACDTHEGSTCLVRCDYKQYYANGTHYYATHETTCRNGIWTKLPRCVLSCGRLNISDTVYLKGKCQGRDKEKCSLYCKDSEALMIGHGTVECKDGEWHGEGAYCTKLCSPPHLPPHLSISPDFNCSRNINTQCKVKCEKPYVVIGKDTITCDSSSHWSAFPRCGRLCPEFRPPVKTIPICSRKPTAFCLFTCEPHFKLFKETRDGRLFTQCLPSGYWKDIAICVPMEQVCVLPEHLTRKDPNCELTAGQSCSVRCIGKHDLLIGNEVVFCNKEKELSEVPTCVSTQTTCPDPDSPNVYVLLVPCYGPYKVFSRCTVACRYSGFKLVGGNFIFCEPNGKWSPWPHCIPLCPAGGIPTYLTIIEDACAMEPNTYCAVQCVESDKKLSALPGVLCDEHSRWSIPPVCLPRPVYQCEVEAIPDHLYVVKVYEFDGIFIVGCRDPRYKIYGLPSVICLGSVQGWSVFPTCVPDMEKLPDCPAHIHEGSDFTCPNIEYGSQCTFIDSGCPKPTLRSTYCLRDGWSSIIPACDE